MLHLVNGDGFAAKLRDSGIKGDILVWRESLYEGPIFRDFTAPAARLRRLRYFEDRGVPGSRFQQFTEEQEASLNQFERYNEVVLWFEYDLFDQTMLIYLLQWFARRSATSTSTNLNLLCIDSYPNVHSFKGLGQLTPGQTASLEGTWQPITAGQLQLAVEAWDAYTSAAPTALLQFMRSDTTSLPFLKRSLWCHLRRFPSAANGLNQVEQLTLEAVEAGVHNIASLFSRVSDKVMDYGMGDSQYWTYLNGLRKANVPLIQIQGPELPDYGFQGPPDFEQWKVQLTDTGREVLLGRKDHVQLNGINRWLGGCFLQGNKNVWRWDEGQLMLVKK